MLARDGGTEKGGSMKKSRKENVIKKIKHCSRGDGFILFFSVCEQKNAHGITIGVVFIPHILPA